MSKNPVPRTPETVATLINRKFYALNCEPEEKHLNRIRELLNVVQEEREVTDEEIQGLKKTEKNVIENQNAYKETTEHSKIKAKYSIGLFLCFILLVWFCVKNKQPLFAMLVRCPIDLIAVGIYFYKLYGSYLGFGLGIFKPAQPKVSDNEEEDWEDSMTSTGLHSRQKALVNGWEQVEKERREKLKYDFLPFIARLTNMIFFGLRVFFIHRVITEKASLFSSPLFTEPNFLAVQYIISIVLAVFFVVDFLVENERRQNRLLGLICLAFIVTGIEMYIEEKEKVARK